MSANAEHLRRKPLTKHELQELSEEDWTLALYVELGEQREEEKLVEQ